MDYDNISGLLGPPNDTQFRSSLLLRDAMTSNAQRLNMGGV